MSASPFKGQTGLKRILNASGYSLDGLRAAFTGEAAFRQLVLLNAVLTVRAHEAASHAGHGWETFTDAVVRAIAQRKQGIVYMLWGSYAQRKGAIADPQRNCILKAVHPSPLSAYRGFFGSKHFSRANEYLQSIGKAPILW